MDLSWMCVWYILVLVVCCSHTQLLSFFSLVFCQSRIRIYSVNTIGFCLNVSTQLSFNSSHTINLLKWRKEENVKTKTRNKKRKIEREKKQPKTKKSTHRIPHISVKKNWEKKKWTVPENYGAKEIIFDSHFHIHSPFIAFSYGRVWS